MLSRRYTKVKDAQSVFNSVMYTHTLFEDGEEKLSTNGKKILHEWGKIHGVSFNHPIFLARWRESLRRRIKDIPYKEEPKEIVPDIVVPKKKQLDFRYPRAKQYADYLREWKKKVKKRTVAEIRARMERDREERGPKPRQ